MDSNQSDRQENHPLWWSLITKTDALW